MNIQLDNETRLCALLSGYIRELKEGADYESTTLKLASTIDRMYDDNPEIKTGEFTITCRDGLLNIANEEGEGKSMTVKTLWNKILI